MPTFKKYQKRKNIKLESLLYRDLNKIIYKYLSLLSFSESQINVQKKIIIDHIYMGMDKLYNDIKLYEEHFKKNKFKYLLSAGFYGPLANQLFYLCKKYNVHLIGFEHDTERKAKKMEEEEKNILNFVDIKNPYI